MLEESKLFLDIFHTPPPLLSLFKSSESSAPSAISCSMLDAAWNYAKDLTQKQFQKDDSILYVIVCFF